MKKKLLPLLALTALISASLLPMSVANAASYYPGYTCHYRDISGSCLSYQTQNPYYLNGSYGTQSRSLYGNRQTYPFRAMFNAQSTTQTIWDNRANNRNNYYRAYRYEEDDDDNDYIDDDDDAYNHFYGDDDDEDRGAWRWYYDEDDDTYNRYRYENDDYYEDDDDNDYYDEDEDYWNYWNDDDEHEDYEHTRFFCTGSDCSSTYFRY